MDKRVWLQQCTLFIQGYYKYLHKESADDALKNSPILPNSNTFYLVAVILSRMNIHFTESAYNFLMDYLNLSEKRCNRNQCIVMDHRADFMKNTIFYDAAYDILMTVYPNNNQIHEDGERLALTAFIITMHTVDMDCNISATYGSLMEPVEKIYQDCKKLIFLKYGLNLDRVKKADILVYSTMIPILAQIRMGMEMYYRYDEKDIYNKTYSYLYDAQISKDISNLIENAYHTELSRYNVSRIYNMVHDLIQCICVPYQPVRLGIYSKYGINTSYKLEHRIKKELPDYILESISMIYFWQYVDDSSCEFLLTDMKGVQNYIKIPCVELDNYNFKELARLKKLLLKHGYHLHDIYKKILPEEMMYFDNYDAEALQPFLKKMVHRLAKDEQHEEKLYQSIFDKLCVSSTNSIAFFFVDYSLTEKNVFEIYHLSCPIYWWVDKVEYIMVLSIPKPDQPHEHRFLSDLVYVLCSYVEYLHEPPVKADVDMILDKIVEII